MPTEKLTRICLLVNRKAGISEEEFHQHWANNHGPLVTDWLIRYGIVRYNQFHVSSEHHKKGHKFASIAQFDGIAEFWVHRYEDMQAAYADPVYLEKILPDELKFLEPQSAVFSIGVDVPVIEGNKPVGEQSKSCQ